MSMEGVIIFSQCSQWIIRFRSSSLNSTTHQQKNEFQNSQPGAPDQLVATVEAAQNTAAAKTKAKHARLEQNRADIVAQQANANAGDADSAHAGGVASVVLVVLSGFVFF